MRKNGATDPAPAGPFVGRERACYVPVAPRRRSRERGSTLVEFGLLMIPLFALVLLIMDVGWSVFAEVSLQEAVREGVRWGITGQLYSGCSGLDCSIKKVVQEFSFGFATASNISIHYYSPQTLTDVTGQPGATAGGNILQVAISGVTVKSFGALLRQGTPLPLGASASDVMEALPIVTPE
jgi:hypothetical protein